MKEENQIIRKLFKNIDIYPLPYQFTTYVYRLLKTLEIDTKTVDIKDFYEDIKDNNRVYVKNFKNLDNNEYLINIFYSSLEGRSYGSKGEIIINLKYENKEIEILDYLVENEENFYLENIETMSIEEKSLRLFLNNLEGFFLPSFFRYGVNHYFKNKNINPMKDDISEILLLKDTYQNGLFMTEFKKLDKNKFFMKLWTADIQMLSGDGGEILITFELSNDNEIKIINLETGSYMMS